MIKVIINADDLGLNPCVNKTIDEALSNGFITSSTILANSDYMDEVRRIVRKHPSSSFGVHLNLTSGRSLTVNPIFVKYGIMDGFGNFIMKQSFKICPNAGKELLEAIKQEWSAQIDLLLQYGIPLSHADGHHHCHSWYGLTEVFTELMSYYNLTRSRQRYIYPEKASVKIKIKAVIARLCDVLNFKIYEQNNSVSRHFAYDAYTLLFNKKLRISDIKTTDYFCSYNDMHRIMSASNLCLNDGDTIELMCHPGSERFAHEYADIILDQNNIRNNNNYQQISFSEI